MELNKDTEGVGVRLDYCYYSPGASIQGVVRQAAVTFAGNFQKMMIILKTSKEVQNDFDRRNHSTCSNLA